MAQAAELLAGEYTVAITNVPYLGREYHSDALKGLADEQYKEAKADLATMFVERMMRWLGDTGTVAAVSPQNWLFLISFKKLRENLLKRWAWNFIARLGEHAFQSSSAAGAFAAMVILSSQKPHQNWALSGIDVSAPRGQKPIYPLEKAALLRGEFVACLDDGQADGTVSLLMQADLRANVDAIVSLVSLSQTGLLLDHGVCVEGLSTGDMQHYVMKFWEIPSGTSLWSPFVQNVDETTLYGGRSDYLRWEMGKGELSNSPSAHNFPPDRVKNIPVLGNQGIRITQMSRMAATLYDGEIFGKNGGTLVLHDRDLLPAVWCYCQSQEYSTNIRIIDQSLAVTVGTMVKVPFDLDRWDVVAAKKYPNGLPKPQSDDPTQWLFHGHPARAEPATVLQVAVGRLLGYQWPPELDHDMRLAYEAREWVAHCGSLKDYSDKDGIICLSATRGERSAAEHLLELLSAAFGSNWSAAKERELLNHASDPMKPADSLDIWLRDRFFEEHCKLFHHRPFVWHIWDGNKDGFHCLVNAHKLTGPDGEGRRTLQAITYSYLGDWIDRQKAEQADGKEGADARLAAAQDLAGQLEKILEGEPPYDLFVRWKPLHEQAIGWEPDINDGVRLNIRPFMNAKLRKGGKKGAGILRWKPNIKWKKDRGKEPESLRPKADFPWFWNCNGSGSETERTNFTGGPEFDGNRWNDLHCSNAFKVAARERSEEKSKA